MIKLIDVGKVELNQTNDYGNPPRLGHLLLAIPEEEYEELVKLLREK